MPVWKQDVVVEPYLKRVKTENSRYFSWQKQSSSQQGVVWQHWKVLRRLLTSERGAWANRCHQFRPLISSKFLNTFWVFSVSMFLISRVQSEVNWKLSSAETYSKMRLKLVPNYNYDPHSDASAQRDNLGMNLGLNVVLYSYMLFTPCMLMCVRVCVPQGPTVPAAPNPCRWLLQRRQK